ncbi:MAG: sulfatase-like hydrolase/transferase [Rubripirellula sp.]|nr:sulfatase-like hydrolase/transferase [Rubripirellula sp.]
MERGKHRWQDTESTAILRLVLFGLLSAVASTGIIVAVACWSGETLSGKPSGILSQFPTLIWIVSQSLTMILPTLGFASLLYYCSGNVCIRQLGFLVAACLILCMPVVILLDSVVFGWTGERLFSDMVGRIVSGHLPTLQPFLSGGMVSAGVLIGLVGIGVPVLICCLSGLLLRRFASVTPTRSLAGLSGLYAFLLLAGWAFVSVDRQHAMASMQGRTISHPLYVFRVFSSGGTGTAAVPDSMNEQAPDSLRVSSYAARQQRLRIASAVLPASSDIPSDVLLVVIESFRPELIDQAVMPNLSQLTDRGIHCKFHFSGGNATNHGVFSLVSGLEPVWFDTQARFDPALNRWFRNLGYEIGFFAGADDWREFRMDGFIRPELFDVYHAKPRNGLASDRRATELAGRFLDRVDLTENEVRRPRLAFLYLYGTHATYQSYPMDQLDLPAADERYPFPYPKSMRSLVWNRYRNSARTVDRLLGTLLADDRVIAVTGDHGEAFLEDNTIGHGLRLSRYQNMTPAVFYGPDTPARVIGFPTMHADLLPTLISMVGATLTDPDATDGLSLLACSNSQLEQRVLITRNYLVPDYALIGSWTRDTKRPFAFRVAGSLKAGTITAFNAIDERGFQTTPSSPDEMSNAIRRWERQAYRWGESDPP